jgi:hypothetical protein
VHLLILSALVVVVATAGCLVAGASPAPSNAVPFGDAHSFASSGGEVRLARPIVGMARSLSGRGYWLVASDGRVFNFGDAESFGPGREEVAGPVVGMAPSWDRSGYWLVGSGGGVFPFGDAGLQLPLSGATNFKPPVPGAPVIRVEANDSGLHFTPSHIECGVYNVAFSDTRTDRIPGTDVVLHFEKTFPPFFDILSVHAGQTGGSLLGFGGVGWAVTVDPDVGSIHTGSGQPHSDGQLIIDPPSDPTAPCATPIT